MKFSRRSIKKITYILFYAFVSLSLTWFYGSYKISEIFNQNFADKDMRIQNISFKFSKALVSGFPNKISIQLLDFKEFSQDGDITYKNPLKIGYNILTQNIFVSYNGELESSFKNSGQKYRVSGDFNYYLHYPLTPSLIKNLFVSNDYFELINFIKKVEIDFANIEGSDLSNNKKVYEQKHLRAVLAPEKTLYYKSLPEFLTNPPRTYDLKLEIDANQIDKNPLPLSILYLPLSSKAIKGDLNCKLDIINQNIALSKLKDIFNNFKLEIRNYDLQYGGFNIKGNGLLSLKNDQYYDFNIKLNSDLIVTESLFVAFKTSFIEAVNRLKKYKYIEGDHIFNVILSNPDIYIPQIHKIGLTKSNFDININNNDGNNNIDIKKFEIKNEYYSLLLENRSVIGKDLSIKSDGKLLLGDYKQFVSLVVGYLQRYTKILSEFDASFVKISSKSFINSINTFLKFISNYPRTTSNELIFNINIDSKENISRFGSISTKDAQDILVSILVQDMIKEAAEGKTDKVLPSNE